MAAPAVPLPENQLRELLAVLGRRRAWWIVPLLLGAVAGVAGIALLPRRYVAKTEVEVRPISYEEEVSRTSRESPIVQEIATVEVEVKALSRLEKVVTEDVPTPEYALLSREGRLAYLEALQKRVEVRLLPRPRDPGGEIVQIFCRDVEGERAADLANAVRRRWQRDVLGRYRERIVQDLQVLNERAAERQRDYDQARQAVEQHQTRNRMDPGLTSKEAKEGDWLLKYVRDLEDKLFRRQEDLAGKKAVLEVARAQFKPIEEWIEVPAPAPTDDPKTLERIAVLKAKIAAIETKQKGLKPALPAYQHFESEKAALKSLLADEEGAPVASRPATRRRSEAWLAQKGVVEIAERELAEVESHVAGLQGEVDRWKQEAENRPAIYASLGRLEDLVDFTKDRLDQVKKDRQRTRDLLDRIQSKEGDPFVVLQEAYTPIRPSEPNPVSVFLVSLLVGAGVGLALASAREYARTSFRTLEDAVRSLPVPVLGAVSWVWTEVERRRAKRRRLFATLATGTAAVLLVSLFAAYSLKPQALPPPVTSLLDSIRRSLR